MTPSGSKKATATNAPAATPERIAAWHTALQQKAGATPDPLTAAAIYVTGNTNADLPVLQGALERADREGLARFSRSAALAAILPRLPWPAGQPVIERLCRTPSLFLSLVAHRAKSDLKLREFLFDPARFRAAVEAATAEDLALSLPRLMASDEKQLSLASSTPRMTALVTSLLDATNAAWRAAAVYIIGSREDDQGLPQLERALKDTNAWVRAAAIPGLARTAKDRATLEQRLGPLMADPDKRVAQMAALGLLEPETRSAAGLDYEFEYFEFEQIRASHGYSSRDGEQRPLEPIPGKPAFLEQARKRLTAADKEQAALPALLLAQYGDFSGLDGLLPAAGPTTIEEHRDNTALLAGITLSRDAKYIPYLKKLTAATTQDYELRRLLQALKGMSGPEARELRLEINKRMRQGTVE